MEYTREELQEAKRQIDSTLHKLREALRTFEGKEQPGRFKSQITLAKNRIRAFELANRLIQRELLEPVFTGAERPPDGPSAAGAPEDR